MKCPSCGANMSNSTHRCEYCGTYVEQAQPVQAAPEAQPQTVVVQVVHQHESSPRYRYSDSSSRSRIVALLLCLFFGWIGVHKFYLGRVGLGLVYLCTGGLLGIGVMYDLLVLLFGSPRDGQDARVRWYR